MISGRDSEAFEEAAGYVKQNKYIFGLRYLKNWFLERMASWIPIPSWRVFLHRSRGIKIGKEVYIGSDIIFDSLYPELITIEDYAEIGDRCIITVHSRGSKLLLDKYPRNIQPVKIGEGAWIAPACVIIQGVEIGKKAVIGTGAVVTKDIPDNCVAVGVPAKVIKRLE